VLVRSRCSAEIECSFVDSIQELDYVHTKKKWRILRIAPELPELLHLKSRGAKNSAKEFLSRFVDSEALVEEVEPETSSCEKVLLISDPRDDACQQ